MASCLFINADHLHDVHDGGEEAEGVARHGVGARVLVRDPHQDRAPDAEQEAGHLPPRELLEAVAGAVGGGGVDILWWWWFVLMVGISGAFESRITALEREIRQQHLKRKVHREEVVLMMVLDVTLVCASDRL